MNLVSIIIPCYQAELWLGRCIESCLAQKQFIREIILVNDFSSDGTQAVIDSYTQKYPDLIKGFHNEIKGGNNARNFGFRQSSGEYIQWLDADDEILPGKLEQQVSFLEKNKSVDIAYSSARLDSWSPSGTLVKTEPFVARDYEDYLLELVRDNWLPMHVYLLRRNAAEVLDRQKGWNQSTPVAQDREYFTKAAINGFRFGFVPGEFVVYNRILNQSSVSQKMKMPERSRWMIQLLAHLRDEILAAPHIAPHLKPQYCRLLTTQIAYYAALYGHDAPFQYSLKDIQWRWIPGIRSKLKVLFRVVRA